VLQYILEGELCLARKLGLSTYIYLFIYIYLALTLTLTLLLCVFLSPARRYQFNPPPLYIQLDDGVSDPFFGIGVGT
jgi:hypothetical protein